MNANTHLAVTAQLDFNSFMEYGDMPAYCTELSKSVHTSFVVPLSTLMAGHLPTLKTEVGRIAFPTIPVENLKFRVELYYCDTNCQLSDDDSDDNGIPLTDDADITTAMTVGQKTHDGALVILASLYPSEPYDNIYFSYYPYYPAVPQVENKPMYGPLIVGVDASCVATTIDAMTIDTLKQQISGTVLSVRLRHRGHVYKIVSTDQLQCVLHRTIGDTVDIFVHIAGQDFPRGNVFSGDYQILWE